MRNKIKKALKEIFSLSLIISIFGGGVIFVMFVIAFIIGGTSGGNLSVMAAETIMPVFIRLAAIAIASGLASIYIDGKHTLSMKEK